MRFFYGIDFPESVKAKLASTQRTLQQAGIQAGNWSDPSLFHCTVLFLGELSHDTLSALKQVGETAASHVPPFSLSIAGDVGVFARNKVLWMDVVKDEGWKPLVSLHDNTRREIEPHRLVQLENRPFRAHITLARKVDSASIRQIESRSDVGTNLEGFPLDIPVEHLCLFESTRIQGKLTYPVRERFALTGQPE